MVLPAWVLPLLGGFLIPQISLTYTFCWVHWSGTVSLEQISVLGLVGPAFSAGGFWVHFLGAFHLGFSGGAHWSLGSPAAFSFWVACCSLGVHLESLWVGPASAWSCHHWVRFSAIYMGFWVPFSGSLSGWELSWSIYRLYIDSCLGTNRSSGPVRVLRFRYGTDSLHSLLFSHLPAVFSLHRFCLPACLLGLPAATLCLLYLPYLPGFLDGWLGGWFL